MRIVVLGYVVRCPLGGMAWHYLQYVQGLAALGHDVLYLEDSEDHQWSCYDPVTHRQGIDPTHGLEFAKQVFDRLGLGERWAYFDAHTDRWLGPRRADAAQICADADVVLNISGANPIRPWLESVPARVFIDTDPAFEQVRQLTVPRRAERAAEHNVFFSFGENIGRSNCRVPDDGLRWQPTRQPIVLSAWPDLPCPEDAPFTTVMQWDSYECREYEGVEYGMKSKSFDSFIDLPRRVDAALAPAVGSRNAPRDLLRERGWQLQDPLAVTHDPWTYQAFIQASRGEFSVAKHGYVVSRSGWFSERSAAYLASGRPVITQDTGFGDWLDADAGVWAVRDVDQAVAAIDVVCRDYPAASAAARDVAQRYFDADRVLNELLERAVQ